MLQVAIPYAATELPTALGMDARLLLQPRLLIPQRSQVEALGVVAPASENYTRPSSILDTIDTCEARSPPPSTVFACLEGSCSSEKQDVCLDALMSLQQQMRELAGWDHCMQGVVHTFNSVFEAPADALARPATY